MNQLYILAATDATTHSAEQDSHTSEALYAASESTTHTSAEVDGHEEQPQGIAALGIEPFAIAAQLVTFLVLFWVVKKFALDGIVANLDKRHKDINRGLKLTAELDKQKAELDAQVESVLRTARKDADSILADAQAESQRMIRSAEDAAQSRVDDMIKSAEGKIAREVSQARVALRGEMAQLITLATEKILTKKLDASQDRELIETYVSEALK